MRMRSRTMYGSLVGLGLVGVVAVAGCSSGSKYSASVTPPKTATGGAAAVTVQRGALGTYLTDAQGRTLYEFAKDQGTTSMCTGSCTVVWPPLTATGTPSAGSGTAAAQLGTTMRSDGQRQVTYAGHPLYYYAQDGSAGDTFGQGLNSSGGRWWVLSPAGTVIKGGGSGGGSTGKATTGTSGGYGSYG